MVCSLGTQLLHKNCLLVLQKALYDPSRSHVPCLDPDRHEADSKAPQLTTSISTCTSKVNGMGIYFEYSFICLHVLLTTDSLSPIIRCAAPASAKSLQQVPETSHEVISLTGVLSGWYGWSEVTPRLASPGKVYNSFWGPQIQLSQYRSPNPW